MAPESSTPNAPGANNAAAPIRQNVAVPKPDTGADVSVTSSAGGQLQLGFDPGTATATRSGNDLSFQVDDGGKVTIKDFFAVGDESLPSLRLPDGTVVASTDFFSGSGLDMTTAAGPGGGGGATGSGSGEYSDDPGSLIGGIDRFGKLGTDFWGRDSEVPERMIGRESPGGTFDMPVDTDLGGLFAAGAFEDARPMQYRDGDNAALNAGQIHFNFTPTGTTEVDAIRLTGFDSGTRIFIGDPASGGYEVFPNANGVYSFSPDQFNPTGGVGNPGVYIIPPENSDHDMTISAQVDIHARSSGVERTLSGNFTVIVDAVADLPTDGQGEFVAADAVAQDNAKTAPADMISEAKSVPIDLSFQFGDWQDTSESHYIQIKDVPAGWTLTGAPFGGASHTVVDNGDGTVTYIFDVTDYASANSGLVADTVSFNPHDWTNDRLDDGTDRGAESGPAEITVSAVAEENIAAGEQELDWNNNRSEVELDVITVSIQEDTPDITSNKLTLGTNEQAGTQSTEMNFTDLAASTQALANAQATVPPLGVDQQTFTFNLYSDGATDGKDGGLSEGKPSVSFDSFPVAGDLLAKLPGAAGYTALQSQSVTDASGNTTLTYFWTDSATSANHVALVVIIEPTFNADGTGSANMTVIQYAALQHADDGTGRNDLSMDFTLKVTDNDGDSTTIDATYVVKDDIPDAGSNVSAVFDEKIADDTDNFTISGNVLDKTVTDHDPSNNSTSYDPADSGSDGWQGGNQGVVSFDVTLPGSFSLGGQTGLTGLAPGSYVILDANGNAQGTFTLGVDGNWSFTKGTGQDVIKDFDFKVTYTVKDADGDTDTADLTINAKAAPVLVGISGDRQVFESNQAETNPNGSVNDAAGVAVYTIQAYNYDGTDISGNAIYEDIFVTVTVIPGTAGLGDLDLAKVMALNTGVVTAVNTATGEITIKIPANDTDGKVELKLPMADDSLGDKVTGSDGPTEDYTLEVTKVEGNTSGHYVQPGDSQYADKGISTGQQTTIIDDGAKVTWNDTTGQWDVDGYLNNRLDGASPYQHATDEHPLDGPMIGLSASSSVTEGKTTNLRLSGTNPDTGAAYGANTNPSEPIELTMQFSLTGGAEAADVTVKYASVTGAAYQYSTDGGTTWANIPSAGIPSSALSSGSVFVKVTLGTNFDLNKLGSVGLNVTAVNDNFGNETDEGFSLTITGATGNEVTYYGDTKTTTITDEFKASLTISDADRVWEGGTLEYTLKLTTDTKITATNTGTVEAVLEFGGSAAWGKDYTLADIEAANPKLQFVDLSGQSIPGATDGSTYPAGTVKVIIEGGDWTAGTSTGGSVKLNVPTVHDNQIGENDESITITIKNAEGAELDWASQSKTNVSGEGEVEDRAAIDLTAVGGGKQTGNIYEEDGNAGHPTVATYQVNWKHDTGFGSDGLDDGVSDGKLNKLVATGAGDVAASSFTFDITLTNGTAKFDNNMLNNSTDANTQDYGWAVDGELVQYGDLSVVKPDPADTLKYPLGENEPQYQADLAAYDAGPGLLLDAINKYLEDNDYEGITAIGVSADGRTITFAVAEGADLSRPLPIQVGAIDDRLTEGSENYKVTLSNIKATDGTETGHENVIIDGNRTVGTNILDDAGNTGRDGFLVGLGDNSGNESDKKITLPVLLFGRDENGNAIDADPNNPPSQTITLTLIAGENTGDTADIDQDYYTDNPGSNTITITIPGETDPANPVNWVYVDASGNPGDSDYVPGHWEAKNASIPLNDDRLTEGDEDFSVKLHSVSGNESSVLADADHTIPGVSESANLTIVDDYLKDGNLDGPALDFFGPTGQVIEPKATGTPGADADGDQINAEIVVNTVNWQVAMDATVAQDTVVFIKIVDETWSDFKPEFGDGTGGTLGKIGDPADHANGIYTLAELQAMYPTYDIDPNGGGYFVIIPKDSASTTFAVNILHDHDTASVNTGVDAAKEYVDMTITNIQGSENTFDKENPGTAAHSREEILDDLRGPSVSLETSLGTAPADSDRGGNYLDLTARIAVAVTEDVDVTVTVIRSDGTSVNFTVTIPAGQTEVTETVRVGSGYDYCHTQITGVSGGEAQRNDGVGFVDLPGGPGTNPPIVLGGLTATDIAEEGETTVGYTLTGTIPSGHVNEDLTFTLKVLNNTSENGDFKEGGPGQDVSITIPKEMLDACGDAFNLEITKDGVKLYDKDGQEVDSMLGGGITVTGDLAQALDDRLIEGNEGFTTIITNITGNGTVTGSDSIATSTIEDNDKPILKVVFCDKDGTALTVDDDGNPIQHGLEGQGDVYVKVILVDADGNPLELGNGALTVDLSADGTATGGTDFVLGRESVVIPNGASESPVVKISLPDDFRSEDSETLVIHAEPNDDATTVQNYPNGFIPGSTSDQTLTIDEFINGPQITFTADRGTVGESGSVSYSVTLDKVLEENATLTFRVDLASDADGAGDTATGFVLDDIKSIEVDGKTYTYDSDDKIFKDAGGNDGSAKVYLDADGNLIIKMEMSEGYSKENFRINLNNDHITEKIETLKVTLIETEGGELGYGGTNADGSNRVVGDGNMPFASTNVTDVLDGPSISLYRVDTEGTEGESVTVGISLSKSTVSDTTITLTLGNDVYEKVVDGSGTILLTDNSGDAITGATVTDNQDGTVTITLPKDVSGPLKVEFPLQDNATEGTNPSFSVSLDASGISGGEASLAGGLSYGSEFVKETNTSTVFVLEGSGTPAADATCVITLSGIPGNDTDKVASISFTLDGTAYTVLGSDLALSGGVLTYTVPGKVGVSLDGVQVTVTYNTGAMTDAELAQAKLNASVSGSLSGMEVTIGVLDDDNTALQDGPVLSIADGDGVTEGAEAEFTITLTPKADFEMTGQAITLTFTVSGDNVDLDAVTATGYNVTRVGTTNQFTITVPTDTDLTGGLDITLNVGTKTDTVIGTDSEITVELTKVEGGEASISATGAATAETDVAEGSTANLIVSGTILNVTEGGTLGFTLQLQDASGPGQSMTAATDIAAVFSVAAVDIGLFLTADTVQSLIDGGSHTAGGLTWTYDNDGTYHVEATLPSGQSSATISIPTIEHVNHLIENADTVALTLIDVRSDDAGVDSQVTHTPGTSFTATIQDAQYAEIDGKFGLDAADLVGNELYHVQNGVELDASANMAGMVILGTDGDDTIRAGAGDNIIHGGAGNDVMYGGAGSDTFLWLAEDFGNAITPANDTIHDFQVGSDLIHFKDVFGGEGSIDNLLGGADVDSVTNTVRFTGNGTTFEAEFKSPSELLLTLTDGSGGVQTIDVNTADGSFSSLLTSNDFDNDAVEILKNMLKDGNF